MVSSQTDEMLGELQGEVVLMNKEYIVQVSDTTMMPEEQMSVTK